MGRKKMSDVQKREVAEVVMRYHPDHQALPSGPARERYRVDLEVLAAKFNMTRDELDKWRRNNDKAEMQGYVGMITTLENLSSGRRRRKPGSTSSSTMSPKGVSPTLLTFPSTTTSHSPGQSRSNSTRTVITQVL